jgi:hypothetical protein
MWPPVRQDLLGKAEMRRAARLAAEWGVSVEDEVYREFYMADNVCYTAVRDQAGELIGDARSLGTIGNNNQLVRGLGYLPVICCGSTDNSPDVDEVPLLTMARAAVKSYQLSADYFTALHQTSHPQPWVAGLDENVELGVTGPSAAWDLGPNGSCGYLEFQGAGIEAVRTAMGDQKSAALGGGGFLATEASEAAAEVEGVEACVVSGFSLLHMRGS